MLVEAGRGRGLRVHRPGRAPGARGRRRVRARARVRAGGGRARPRRRRRHRGRRPQVVAARGAAPAGGCPGRSGCVVTGSGRDGAARVRRGDPAGGGRAAAAQHRERADRACGCCWCRCSSSRCSSTTAQSVRGGSRRSGCSPWPRSPTGSTASWPAAAASSPRSARSPTRSRTRRSPGSALVGLSMLGLVPWWVTIVIMGREIGITLLRFCGAAPRDHPGQPRRQGEDAGAGDRHRALPAAAARADRRRDGRGLGAWACCWRSRCVLTVVTGLDYVLRAMRLRATAPTVVPDSSDAG